MKNKGCTNQMAYISVAIFLRVPNMVPIECVGNALLPWSLIAQSYISKFCECYIKIPKFVILMEN